MKSSRHILSHLDERARAFEFPVVHNVSFAVLAARLRGFTRGNDWAMVFEWLGFSEHELSFPIDLYCYGSVFMDGGFALRQLEGIELDPESWTADSIWQPLESISFRIGTTRYIATQNPTAAQDIQIAHGDLKTEVAFGHAIVRELGLGTVLDRKKLLAACPELLDLTEVITLCDWDHPDVESEQVARSEGLRHCAIVLSGESDDGEYEHSSDSLRARALARRHV